MEIKKSKRADLERKRTLFFQIGLMVTLGVVLVAFEWSSVDTGLGGFVPIDEEILEEEAPPITRREEIKPPPPPPPPKAHDLLNIVDNDVDLDEELEIEDTELDQDFEVDLSNLSVEEEDDDQQIFIVVEEMPEFPGGSGELFRFISKNVKYPVICQENGVQGRVSVSFVVDEKGNVVNVQAYRGVDPNLEREAVRVVKSMPKWKPGKQRGRNVKVSYTVPVNFKLQ
ncbi:energy transducer TonB [Carboxylicivirga sp. M1479]|uniref:energy transducer TonB n=1 Tax=Carboxylicivirga sp. M1479 TaxID=2594476 RepID=UPI0011784659|nr:energy transducer TonB [Carboxylicivirga sp. M1479]TRX71110.1 energy transducer TonB [Carboxylicivirga sp. M1479]